MQDATTKQNENLVVVVVVLFCFQMRMIGLFWHYYSILLSVRLVNLNQLAESVF